MSFPRLPKLDPKLRLALIDAERIAGRSLPSPSYWQIKRGRLPAQAIGAQGDIFEWDNFGWRWTNCEGGVWQRPPDPDTSAN